MTTADFAVTVRIADVYYVEGSRRFRELLHNHGFATGKALVNILKSAWESLGWSDKEHMPLQLDHLYMAIKQGDKKTVVQEQIKCAAELFASALGGRIEPAVVTVGQQVDTSLEAKMGTDGRVKQNRETHHYKAVGYLFVTITKTTTTIKQSRKGKTETKTSVKRHTFEIEFHVKLFPASDPPVGEGNSASESLSQTD